MKSRVRSGLHLFVGGCLVATPPLVPQLTVSMRTAELQSLVDSVVAEARRPPNQSGPRVPVLLDAGSRISYSENGKVHEADFRSLPIGIRQVWTQWASYTEDEPSGEQLFADMFYRFFLVHEAGHILSGRAIDALPEPQRAKVSAIQIANATEREMVPNRIAVAWFREHDPAYLLRLVNDFRRIQARMPNPVPSGDDTKQYFKTHYLQLAKDPQAYGWYQLQMVITAYEEPPQTYRQVIDSLSQLRWTEE